MYSDPGVVTSIIYSTLREMCFLQGHDTFVQDLFAVDVPENIHTTSHLLLGFLDKACCGFDWYDMRRMFGHNRHELVWWANHAKVAQDPVMVEALLCVYRCLPVPDDEEPETAQREAQVNIPKLLEMLSELQGKGCSPGCGCPRCCADRDVARDRNWQRDGRISKKEFLQLAKEELRYERAERR